MVLTTVDLTKKHLLYDSIYIQHLKQAKLIWTSEKSGKGDEGVTGSEYRRGTLLGVENIMFFNLVEIH